jgi:hypothetical protein
LKIPVKHFPLHLPSNRFTLSELQAKTSPGIANKSFNGEFPEIHKPKWKSLALFLIPSTFHSTIKYTSSSAVVLARSQWNNRQCHLNKVFIESVLGRVLSRMQHKTTISPLSFQKERLENAIKLIFNHLRAGKVHS